MQFEWDVNKNKLNKSKHGLSFETASFAFQDPFLLSVRDERHHYTEERWQSLGQVEDVLLYIAHTLEEDNDGEENIRIISARAATSSETKRYDVYRSNVGRT